MSKEKHEAWRSMREVSDRDARTMREMYMHSQEQRSNILLPLWNSERKRLVDGKWYIPLSEVSEALTAPPMVEPLSEEWQAKIFPNLNIGSGMGEPINAGKPTPKEDSKRWFSVMDRKQRGRS